jgi:hypothetical protein
MKKQTIAWPMLQNRLHCRDWSRYLMETSRCFTCLVVTAFVFQRDFLSTRKMTRRGTPIKMEMARVPSSRESKRTESKRTEGTECRVHAQRRLEYITITVAYLCLTPRSIAQRRLEYRYQYHIIPSVSLLAPLSIVLLRYRSACSNRSCLARTRNQERQPHRGALAHDQQPKTNSRTASFCLR